MIKAIQPTNDTTELYKQAVTNLFESLTDHYAAYQRMMKDEFAIETVDLRHHATINAALEKAVYGRRFSDPNVRTDFSRHMKSMTVPTHEAEKALKAWATVSEKYGETETDARDQKGHIDSMKSVTAYPSGLETSEIKHDVTKSRMPVLLSDTKKP